MTEWPGSEAAPEPGLVTFTVVIHSTDLEALQLQATADGISVTDVVHRSITIGQLLWEANSRGERAFIEAKNGEVREIGFPRAGKGKATSRKMKR